MYTRTEQISNTRGQNWYQDGTVQNLKLLDDQQ